MSQKSQHETHLSSHVGYVFIFQLSTTILCFHGFPRSLSEVLIINAGIFGHALLDLRGEALIALLWSRPITAIYTFGRVSEVNLQFGTSQASGRGLDTGVVALLRAN
jgi:hypothetical protein